MPHAPLQELLARAHPPGERSVVRVLPSSLVADFRRRRCPGRVANEDRDPHPSTGLHASGHGLVTRAATAPTRCCATATRSSIRPGHDSQAATGHLASGHDLPRRIPSSRPHSHVSRLLSFHSLHQVARHHATRCDDSSDFRRSCSVTATATTIPDLLQTAAAARPRLLSSPAATVEHISSADSACCTASTISQQRQQRVEPVGEQPSQHTPCTAVREHQRWQRTRQRPQLGLVLSESLSETYRSARQVLPFSHPPS